MEKESSFLNLTRASPNFFWIFLLLIIIILAYRIYLLINSTCQEYENELLNFENEDEKKLYILTRLFTRINKNINNDINVAADIGKKKFK